ncbi:MAG: DegT/DnrJ/EryC1/StrS family aminotransferase [Planctomycetes bacterium]|nr:DegT/DnrJ/EryC1/StrS family aminotransferase [Planctomycetota bacterium]
MATARGVVKLAVCGGKKAVPRMPADLTEWPVIGPEDEQAILGVLHRRAMSSNDVTKQFEAEACKYFGAAHALGYCNGTASLLGAMWACGVAAGTEIIGPSLTYWASVMPAWSLGAGIVFADCQADTLCLDPADIEHRITPRTRAIVCTHNYGHPCDMDAIMAVARKHGLKVIEDASHAQGGLYKGRMLGTIGDVGCMSLMTGKSLVAGEGGLLITNERLLWERAVAFGFYGRTGAGRYTGTQNEVSDPELSRFRGLPLGGVKHRMCQWSAAMGRVQLKHYGKRIAEIQKAMNRFWDCLDGVPGLRAHRVAPDSGSTMGGWYFPMGLYRSEELGGLPIETFCEAVTAEGVPTSPGANFPLHLHAVFHEADVYGHGRPTAVALADRDVRQGPGSLPVSESVPRRVYKVPWLKHDRAQLIGKIAGAFRKVAEHADQLLEKAR